MTDAEMQALRAAAEKATPGPWFTGGLTKDGRTRVEDGRENGLHPFACETHDAAYIALANPAAVLALLDRVAAAEARLDAAWRAGRDAAAAWHDERARIERPISPSSARAEEYAAHAIRALQPPADLAAAAATCDAVAVEREAIAAWLETHVYVTSNVNGARMEPSKRAGDDMHHRTIAAAIRARGMASA